MSTETDAHTGLLVTLSIPLLGVCLMTQCNTRQTAEHTQAIRATLERMEATSQPVGVE